MKKFHETLTVLNEKSTKKLNEVLIKINEAIILKKIKRSEFNFIKKEINLIIEHVFSSYMEIKHINDVYNSPKDISDIYSKIICNTKDLNDVIRKIEKLKVHNDEYINKLSVLSNEWIDTIINIKTIKAFITEKENIKENIIESNNKKTCPCCFNLFSLNKQGGMVHHGYTRPMSGFQTNSCFGYAFLPFEESSEGTERFIVFIEAEIIKKEKELSKNNENYDILKREIDFLNKDLIFYKEKVNNWGENNKENI